MASSQMNQDYEAFWLDRLERTLRITLPSAGRPYTRGDFIPYFEGTVGLKALVALGPTSRGNVWEATLSSRYEKTQLLDRGDFKLRGEHLCHVSDVQQSRYVVKAHWVPYFVPTNQLISCFAQAGGKVVSSKFEKSAVEKLRAVDSGIRVFTVETDNPQSIPHFIRWSFRGQSGQAMLTMTGCRPTCLRCALPGHVRRDCPTPYCTRCNSFGHEIARCTGSSYANAMRPPAAMDQDLIEEDMEAEQADSGAQASAAPPSDKTDTNARSAVPRNMTRLGGALWHISRPGAAASSAATPSTPTQADPPAPVKQAVTPAPVTQAVTPAPATQADPPASLTQADPPTPVIQADPPAAVTQADPPAPVTQADPPAAMTQADPPASEPQADPSVPVTQAGTPAAVTQADQSASSTPSTTSTSSVSPPPRANSALKESTPSTTKVTPAVHHNLPQLPPSRPSTPTPSSLPAVTPRAIAESMTSSSTPKPSEPSLLPKPIGLTQCSKGSDALFDDSQLVLSDDALSGSDSRGRGTSAGRGDALKRKVSDEGRKSWGEQTEDEEGSKWQVKQARGGGGGAKAAGHGGQGKGGIAQGAGHGGQGRGEQQRRSSTSSAPRQ